ncbi:DUF4385 domain-containing protein [Lapillicoccus jejuensis]|uniref:Uncharacterized protein DUF4385 n=1 Tax=Lapillicoccus jejuensis TaxID=402171 RepID=A0A542DYB4_9MICO|nr:DUF4385 domain-containing protein [Lapillicoccus jejuensis]TQJ08049.1 uncharacterized protein DUF4385 [Lapillicoccus jejuensis]
MGGEGAGGGGAGDARARPETYRVGRGEQGVLTVEPYKSELLPLWRFRTPDVARTSADALRAAFDTYLADGDLVGADMARKFLQMGFTRARRYANHPGGRKYDGPVPAGRRGVSGAHGRAELPRGPQDETKAESARIFKEQWDGVEQVEAYTTWRAEHRRTHG